MINWRIIFQASLALSVTSHLNDTPTMTPLLFNQAMNGTKSTPHLDPLPSSDEGRGNPITPFSHASAFSIERDQVFPLPFTRGEDQGEGLIRRPIVFLTMWQYERGERMTALALARSSTQSPSLHPALSPPCEGAERETPQDS